jgi:hypothetical protein
MDKKTIRRTFFMMEYLWSSGISCPQVAFMKWRELWEKLHTDTTQYFGDRIGKDFIIFNVEKDHPKKLFSFLSDKSVVQKHFLHLYHKFIDRFEIHDESNTNTFTNMDIYCMFLNERKSHLQKTLHGHGINKYYLYLAVTPNDLDNNDHNILSTTNVFGPPISDCSICSHNSWHPTIYGKPSKFCVHFSYLACMYHSIENSTSNYTLIFEDDIYFEKTSEDMKRTCDEFMSSGFDVLYLGFGHCKEGHLLETSPPYKYIIQLPPNQSIICKHAILYKNSYVKKMFWELLPLVECSDVHFNHVNILQEAHVCIPTTPFVFQDRLTFGSHNENGQEDEIPLY